MRILVLIIFGLLGSSGFSQDLSISTEIVTIALDQPVADLFFDNGKGVSRLQANPTGLGEPLSYKGSRRFIVRTSEAEFAMKPPLPAPHAWVDLPNASERILLACLKTGDAPMKMVAYDIGRARLAAGEYRFFNFSHVVISVILGDRKISVQPGKEVLASHASWKNEVTEIDVAMAIIKDGKPRPVYSSQWGNRPGRRNYVFLFDGPQTYKPIRICRFFDVPPKEPEKTQR